MSEQDGLLVEELTDEELQTAAGEYADAAQADLDRIAKQEEREANAQAFEALAREAEEADRRLHDAARAVLEQIPVSFGTIGGGDFVFARSQVIEAVWGDGHKVLWAAEEPFLITGPSGVGKTTAGQQLGLRRSGIITEDLLGFPVAGGSKVLYLAMDRPRQAARSLGRMVTEDQRDALNEHFRVHEGALPFNLLREPPDKLASWAKELGCTTIIVDSLKDIAQGLSEEKAGQAINDAFQACVLNGIEVVALHHHRKSTGDNRKPNRLDDVYGSVWITAGMGSVGLLWGDPGAAQVEFSHLKQPQEVVGPFNIRHDHAAGTMERMGDLNPGAVLVAMKQTTVKAFAMALFGADGKSEEDRARKKLDRLVSNGHAVKDVTRSPITYCSN